MATKISDTEMSSDLTRHTAARWPVPEEEAPPPARALAKEMHA